MRRLNGDLVALATVAKAYGRGDGAQNLYSLAQYGAQVGAIMTPGDVEVGLELVGVESFRLVAPGQKVPKMVQFAIGEGHIILAQGTATGIRPRTIWILLTSVDDTDWAGIVVGWDFMAHGVSSRLPWCLTGHYAICAEPLPDWEGHLP